MSEKEKSPQREVKVVFPDNLKSGVYSNYMFVNHTREEFVLDFMMVTPPIGAVTARVVISPGHMKRMVSTLKGNLEKYEARFGKLAEAVEPPPPRMGFHPPQEQEG